MKLKLIPVLCAVIFLFVSSCGKKEQTPGSEQKDAVQKDPVTQQDVQKKEDSKSDTKPNELGIVEGLPSDYPSDLPKPKNADSLGTIKSSDETSIRYFTSDAPKAIVDYFAQGLEKNGYKKAGGENMKEDGGMIIWNKDKKEITLMLARDKDKNRTAVVVSYK